MGSPGYSVVKKLLASVGDANFIPRLGRIPLRRKWPPTPVFLPRKLTWTKEPGKLWGRKRVEHDLATKQQQFYYIILNLYFNLPYCLIMSSVAPHPAQFRIYQGSHIVFIAVMSI